MRDRGKVARRSSHHRPIPPCHGQACHMECVSSLDASRRGVYTYRCSTTPLRVRLLGLDLGSTATVPPSRGSRFFSTTTENVPCLPNKSTPTP